jgi:hypothetical protein
MVCRELRRQRNSGADFATAWDAAVSVAIRTACEDGWLTILTATRHAWEAGYERRPSRYTDRALGLIGRDLNGNALEYADVDDPIRTCPQCKRRLPKHKKDIAKFCSDKCRRQAHASVPPPQISPAPGAAEGRYVGPELSDTVSDRALVA